MEAGPPPSVFCVVAHYFDQGPGVFEGGSSRAQPELRRRTVEECLAAARAIPRSTVEVAGVPGKSLVPLDVEMTDMSSPMLLPYETISYMASRVDEFDYFVFAEDDIILPARTLQNCVEFDDESGVFEILHPNRLEQDDSGFWYCTDLYANPTWTYTARRWRDHSLRVALSPHSGCVILSKEKLKFAMERSDLSFRGRHFSSELESAPANLLQPFQVFRFDDPDDLFEHYVVHRDRWKLSPDVLYRPNPYFSFHDKRFSWRDLVPPIVPRLWRDFRRWRFARDAMRKPVEASFDPNRELRKQIGGDASTE